ncbi:exo-beta-N-acetylmuramidase NamZ domain-containing protein [Lacipirellula parvula]|uniref:Protein YzbB n=1 Tax=Lacipirellula parvula TaxID=2650471 RepID=A0A5K7XLE3_9BACT|nr:exo-beta-N-acetylmuramidase NamZ domain-containing protein [Lacipirellula parvula]BBO35303.1 protein YzbB [Lacipirellula parvula]
MRYTLSLIGACALSLLLAVDAAQAEIPVVPAASLGLNQAQLDRIDALVKEEIEAKRLPGCVVAIGRTGGIGFLKAYGDRRVEPSQEEMTVDTVFDMASLTKPIATATSVMILVEQGKVRLRNPVAEYIPEFAQNGKENITVEDLLVHRGGLIPDNALSDYEDGEEKAWERLFALPTDRPGKQFIYSDVGFLTLGKIVERASGKNVAEFAAENIFKPLGMKDSGYTPSKELSQRAATTEKRDDEWMRGEVHDPRAYLLNGVAGHAGLFSTAADLAIYCDAFLRGASNKSSQELARGDDGKSAAHAVPPFVMSRATLAEMLRPRDVAGNSRALGWDNKSAYSTNRGELLSSRAVGHGGFTGTAMWIDPELDLFVIFLSNRVHPKGDGLVNPLAGRIGSVAAAAIDGPNPTSVAVAAKTAVEEKAEGAGDVRPALHAVEATKVSKAKRPQVLTGIDVLARDGFKQLAGRKVGLITNHTGLDRDGRRTIDLLANAPGVKLVAIFSPEHGIAGKLDHDGITDARDEATGLKIHSLYGETRKPTAEQLKGIDTIVFDIQDIGCRFYTYESTMTWAMEAAGEHGLKYVVLDRPNPIGGVAMEGPLADGGRESFVGCHTVPLRHGLTVGELATMYRAEREIEVDLEVIKAENWRRGDYWDATGLTWVNQSPNMRSLTEAILYPGMGVWETTNVSVGRGTDTPFELIGAPWIDGQKLAAELNGAGLPGVRFTPIEFTPSDSKFKEQKCGGVNVAITNQAEFNAVAVGLELAATLRRLYPLDWQVKAADRLLINDEVYQAIVAGADRAELEALFADDLKEFGKRRQKFLLYGE